MVVTLVVAGTWGLWAIFSGFPMTAIAPWALGASVLAGMVAAWVSSRALDSVRVALHWLTQLEQQRSFSGPAAEQVSALTRLESQTDDVRLVKLSSYLLVRYGDRLQFLERQRLALEGWLRDQNTRLALMEAEHEKLKITLSAAQQRIHQLEGIDVATGVANRYRFDEALQQAWQQATRSRQALSVIACEIDHFADWVSWQGEDLGDRGIQQLARVLKKQVHRSSDLIGHDQGYRFLILLPNTDAIGALAVAESVRHQFHQDWLQSGHGLAEDRSPSPPSSSESDPLTIHRPIATAQAPATDLPDPSIATIPPEPIEEPPEIPDRERREAAPPPEPIERRMTISLGISTLIPDSQKSPDVAVQSAIRAVARAHRHGGDCVDMDGFDY